MSNEEIFYRISQDALEYYQKHLEELKNDEVILVGDSIFEKDVMNNTKLSKKALSLIKIQSHTVFKDYVQTICSALTVYLNALEKTKDNLEEKLDSNIHFQWDNMNKEIEDVKELQKSLGCKHEKTRKTK